MRKRVIFMSKFYNFLKKIIIPGALCLVMILSDCSRDNNANMNPEGGKDPREGGILNLAGYNPDTLNPLTTKQMCTRDYLYLAYEGLFTVNEDLTVDGVLATGYKSLDKNTVFRINLKEGVRFHDGSAFTAEDVIDTLKYLQLHESAYTNCLDNVRTYKSTDDYTVEIYLKEPQANFMANLDFPILPSGLKASDFKVPNNSFKINGTGRYKYKSSNQYEGLALEKNPNWHSSQMVYIPEIYIRYVDTREQISYAFDSGETDMVTTDYGRWGEFSYGIKHDMYEITTTKYMFVGINTKNSAFSDVNLRKKLASLIDKEHIVDSSLFSHAIEADTPITAKAYFYRKDDDQKKEDAQEFEGDKIKTYILYNEESNEKENIAKYVKTVLEEAGIEAELSKVSYDSYQSKIKSGDYHLYIGEVDMKRDCDLKFLFGSTTVAVPNNDESPEEDSGENDGEKEDKPKVTYRSTSRICNYSNETLDDIINNINSAKDEESAKVAYNNLRVFYEENVPQVPLVHVNDAVFVSKRVMGKLNLNLTSFFADIGEIYLSQKKTTK